MAEDEHIDGWPPEAHRLASIGHVHALGQITLLHNLLEDTIKEIFSFIVPTDQGYAKRLFHSLNNRERIDFLSAIIRENEKDEKVAEAVLTCLRFYDICTDNRNILMHGIYEDLDAATKTLTVHKTASQDPTRQIRFRLPLQELRLVAEHCGFTFVFAWKLFTFLYDRKLPKGRAPFEQKALPEIPPQPRKLTPYQEQSAPRKKT